MIDDQIIEPVKPERLLDLDQIMNKLFDGYYGGLFHDQNGKKFRRFDELPLFEQRAFARALFSAYDRLTIEVEKKDLAVYEVRRQLIARAK